MIETNDYYLSPRNPTANVDQRDLEAHAIRILQYQQIQQAKMQIAMRWKMMLNGLEIPSEAWQRFDQYVEGYVFRHVLLAVNSDPNYPRVLSNIAGPEHTWFGMDVPGARGGDGPDSNYTVIPIAPYVRYEITGKRLDPAPADAPFVLFGSPSFSVAMASLELEDMQFESDGSFVITLGPEPAEGRQNHIQTNPDALLVLARDYRSDWQQVPLCYRVKRLDPPTAEPLSSEQIANRAVRWLLNDMPIHYSQIVSVMKFPANTFTPPVNSGNAGGLASHAASFARLQLTEDDAYVITASPGAAGFHCIGLYDAWTMTLDYGNHTASLNPAQRVANLDGSTTYIVSLRDPGFHNWLDPVGYSEPMVLHRWHKLPRNPEAETKHTIHGELVKLKDLESVLPANMRRCSPEQRKQQIAERQASYALRFAED